ncbi:hypothetical protein PSTG_13845 [Puccinia striiformis f. sp. tritici PST-78]|uniref:Uncharacterized protein n=1 Tax=Puccinia striiformis f. sp. tritici PST-78 TaxID=1165861 RepID=A0A0L0V0S8_9BASI|nr:hypothetical protein PSTG_13845 [Puccinia striiformis f. sp. tritici PST-78]
MENGNILFAMFQNAYRYGRLPREGKEAVRSPGFFRSCLGGYAGSTSVHKEPASWMDSLCEDEWVISTWLRHSKMKRPQHWEKQVLGGILVIFGPGIFFTDARDPRAASGGVALHFA